MKFFSIERTCTF